MNYLFSYTRSHSAGLIILTTVLLLSGCVLEIPTAQTSTAQTSIEPSTESATAVEVAATPLPEEEVDSGEVNSGEVGSTAEQPVMLLPLPEILGSSNLEISAMDWFGDYLILVPQYPERYDNQLFAIERQQILDTIDGTRTGELEVKPVPFNSGLLRLRIPRLYGGFEAIAFSDNRVFLTVEAGISRDMAGYVVAGEVAADLSQIVLDYENYTEIASPTAIGNTSEETLLVSNGQLLTIYEANGINVNPAPVAHQLDMDLSLLGTLSLPNIEYRITDATRVDENGHFWAINYFFPGDGDKLKPFEPEPLAAIYGKGATHQGLQTVERLVEFQIEENRISLTSTPPIQLELFGGGLQVLGRALGDEIPRNWEGLVRLDERGFLLATDKFPDTLLGFVPFPE